MSDPNWRRRPRFWTPERRRELSQMIDEGAPIAAIAAHFGCSRDSIKLACRRWNIPAMGRRQNLYSARGVARLLGIENSEKSVTWWLREGWLKGAQRVPRGPYLGWVVQHADLLTFLEDRRYWHLWDAERIPAESGIRWWALDIRREAYLTTGQVAWRLCVTPAAVTTWIRTGKLPAVRRGNWLIPASALEGFTPPNQRSRAGMRHRGWTAEEDARLIRLRDRGLSWSRISRTMGRSISSVANRHGRLMERREAA